MEALLIQAGFLAYVAAAVLAVRRRHTPLGQLAATAGLCVGALALSRLPLWLLPPAAAGAALLALETGPRGEGA